MVDAFDGLESGKTFPMSHKHLHRKCWYFLALRLGLRRLMVMHGLWIMFQRLKQLVCPQCLKLTYNWAKMLISDVQPCHHNHPFPSTVGFLEMKMFPIVFNISHFRLLSYVFQMLCVAYQTICAIPDTSFVRWLGYPHTCNCRTCSMKHTWVLTVSKHSSITSVE